MKRRTKAIIFGKISLPAAFHGRHERCIRAEFPKSGALALHKGTTTVDSARLSDETEINRGIDRSRDCRSIQTFKLANHEGLPHHIVIAVIVRMPDKRQLYPTGFRIISIGCPFAGCVASRRNGKFVTCETGPDNCDNKESSKNNN